MENALLCKSILLVLGAATFGLWDRKQFQATARPALLAAFAIVGVFGINEWGFAFGCFLPLLTLMLGIGLAWVGTEGITIASESFGERRGLDADVFYKPGDEWGRIVAWGLNKKATAALKGASVGKSKRRLGYEFDAPAFAALMETSLKDAKCVPHESVKSPRFTNVLHQFMGENRVRKIQLGNLINRQQPVAEDTASV